MLEDALRELARIDPSRGMLVTTFNEHVPFNGFLISGGVLLVERDKPDTYGSRKVMVAYSAIGQTH